MSTQLIELQELGILVSIFKDLIKEDGSPYKTGLPGQAAAVKLLDTMIGEKTKRIARMNGVE